LTAVPESAVAGGINRRPRRQGRQEGDSHLFRDAVLSAYGGKPVKKSSAEWAYILKQEAERVINQKEGYFYETDRLYNTK
jgi:hypothetical protein